jgi:hypothetical protein
LKAALRKFKSTPTPKVREGDVKLFEICQSDIHMWRGREEISLAELTTEPLTSFQKPFADRHLYRFLSLFGYVHILGMVYICLKVAYVA